MPRTTGSRATAVRTRVRSIGNLGLARAGQGLAFGQLLAGAAEPALAPRVRGDGLVQGFGAEVGPERIGEVELGVRELPEEEVGDALLAARADEEVGLRRVAHRKMGRQAL